MNVTMPDGMVVENVPDNYTKEQVLALYNKSQPKPIESVGGELSAMDKIKGGARSFVEGQTLGFADEIGSGLAAIPASLVTGQPYGDVYRQMQEHYQKEQGEFERQNPWTAGLLNVAGGLLTAVPGGKKMAATKFAQMNPVKAAIGGGALIGGVGGAGYAPTAEDIPSYSAGGAVAGGLLAPIGYYGGKLGSKAVDKLKRSLIPESPQTTVSRTMGHYMGQDDLTPDELIRAAQATGKEATLSDVGGENLKSLAMTMAQKQGAQKTPAKTFFAERQKGSTKRILDTLKKQSGGDTNYFKNQKAIIDRRFKEASPLYEEAKKGFLTTDDMVNVYNRAQSVVEDFAPAKNALSKFMKGKGEHRTFKTSIKELHSLQRELRDMSTSAYKAGKNELGAAYSKMQKDVINTLSEKNPSYGQARKIWADESSLNEAIEAGRKVLTEDADKVAFDMANRSIAEQEAFINGAVKTIRDKLMSGRETANTATKLAAQTVRERLRGAFPDDKSFNNFINQLDIEDKYAQTYQKIYGGSQTQPRQVGDRELSQVITGRGQPMPGGDVLTKVGNAARKVLDLDEIPQPVIDDITRLMSTPVHKIPPKELASLQKHGITKSDLNKIKGHVSGAITSQSVTQSQRELSR